MLIKSIFLFYFIYHQSPSAEHPHVFHRIRILRLNETTGDWAQEDEWKAHDAPIAKISWAHPEHGPVLASCSFDRTVKIWEELPHQPRTAAQTSKWVERGVLVDAKGSVRSVEFAPPNFGLKLVSGSSQGQSDFFDTERLEPGHNLYRFVSPDIRMS